MRTCHFFSKEELTFCIDERWRADVQNHPFPTRKATLLIGQVPAMPRRTPRGLRALARGRPIPCTCHVPSTKNNIPCPCAPVHADTSARRSGAAKGAMGKTLVFELRKHTFRATRRPCQGSGLESRRFSIRNKHAFNNALLVCTSAVCCVGRWGRHVGEHVGGHRGGRFSIQKGAPDTWGDTWEAPAASVKAGTAVATQKEACKPCCFRWEN